MNKIALLTCLYLLTFCAGISKAQFNVVWDIPYQHSTSPSFSNEGRKVAEDQSGNVFVLADVTSDIDPAGLMGAATYHYVTLSKYSGNGVLLASLNIEVYNHIVSGFDNLSAFGLEIDAAGNVYIGYSTYDIVTGFDVALGKYDNNLLRVWSNIYSTNSRDVGIDMKLDSSGTLYALVRSSNIQTVYSIIKSVPFSSPPLLIYTYAVNTVVLNSIAFDGQSTLYVGGSATKGGYKNAYVSAINLLTNSISWGSLYTPKGILGDDEISEVTIGIDGNIYAIGSSWQGAANGNQVLVLKNQPGNPRFDFVVLLKGITPDTYGKFINASENGWIYLSGVSAHENYAYIFRIPDDGIFSAPGMHFFTPTPSVAYDSITGITLSDMKVTSAKNIYITGGITATSASGAFSAAYLNKCAVVFGNALIDAGGPPSEGQFNDNYEGVGLSLDYGKTDVYWLKNNWDDLHNAEVVYLTDLDVPAPFRTVQHGNGTDELFSISPNPASNYIKLSSNAPITGIEILDMNGGRVYFKQSQDFNLTIDISTFPRGIYVIRAIDSDQVYIRKVILR